jgi:spermidine synthase
MKLENLGNFKFIGDLSLQDADVLANYGKRSPVILEFGVGGSTQLFAQCKPEKLFSVETDPAWVNLTKSRLAKIEDKTDPLFLTYNDFSSVTETHKFDLIFVDGVDNLRRDFAIKTWSSLKDNGVMIFHDTRRHQDFQNAAWVAQLYFNELEWMDVNCRASDFKSSNMTVLFKKPHEPYVNWNHAEDKPLWAYSIPGTDNPELWSQA